MKVDKDLVVCEPKYKRAYMGPMGRCWVYDDKLQLRYTILPSEKENVYDTWYRWYQYGSGLAGFSIAGAKNKDSSVFFAGRKTHLSYDNMLVKVLVHIMSVPPLSCIYPHFVVTSILLVCLTFLLQ